MRANTAYNEVEITFDEIAAEVIGAKLDELHVDFIPNSVFLSPEEFDAVRQLDVEGVTIIGGDAGLGNVVLNFKNRSYFLNTARSPFVLDRTKWKKKSSLQRQAYVANYLPSKLEQIAFDLLNTLLCDGNFIV